MYSDNDQPMYFLQDPTFQKQSESTPANNYSLKVRQNSDMAGKQRASSNPHPKKKPNSFSNQPQGGFASGADYGTNPQSV